MVVEPVIAEEGWPQHHGDARALVHDGYGADTGGNAAIDGGHDSHSLLLKRAIESMNPSPLSRGIHRGERGGSRTLTRLSPVDRPQSPQGNAERQGERHVEKRMGRVSQDNGHSGIEQEPQSEGHCQRGKHPLRT